MSFRVGFVTNEMKDLHDLHKEITSIVSQRKRGRCNV